MEINFLQTAILFLYCFNIYKIYVLQSKVEMALGMLLEQKYANILLSKKL